MLQKHLNMNNNTGKNNGNKDCLFYFGAVILLISFIALIFAAGMFLCKYPKQQKVDSIEMHLKIDSNGVCSNETKIMVDSLITIINSQNNVLKQKYDHLIQQKADEETLFTFIGVVISIIISVFGFFGYRSFKSIEDTAVSNAEGMARRKLDEEMKHELANMEDKMKSKIQEKIEILENEIIPDIVENKMSDNYDKTINAKLDYLNSFKDDFNNLKKKVNDHDKLFNDAKEDGLVTVESSNENSSLGIIEARKKGE